VNPPRAARGSVIAVGVALVAAVTAAGFVMAAAPTVLWRSERPVLYRAVSAYTVR
jgi:hypothetical protein